MGENNLDTYLQFVIGMPGETPESIKKTAEFASYFFCTIPKNRPQSCWNKLCPSLARGTPLYEFARRTGLIAPSIDDEENYLLRISDCDARDGETNINFTDYPKLLLESWHFEIQLRTRMAYIQKWVIENYNHLTLKLFNRSPRVINKKHNSESKSDSDSGYFAYPRRAKDKLAE